MSAKRVKVEPEAEAEAKPEAELELDEKGYSLVTSSAVEGFATGGVVGFLAGFQRAFTFWASKYDPEYTCKLAIRAYEAVEFEGPNETMRKTICESLEALRQVFIEAETLTSEHLSKNYEAYLSWATNMFLSEMLENWTVDFERVIEEGCYDEDFMRKLDPNMIKKINVAATRALQAVEALEEANEVEA